MHRKDAWSGDTRVIVFKTPWEQTRGLRGVAHLPWSTIAIFPNVFAGRFFNTIGCMIPLDIAALDMRDRVLKHWTVNPGTSSVGPMPPGTFKVLEANAGWINSVGKKPT